VTYSTAVKKHAPLVYKRVMQVIMVFKNKNVF